MRTFYHSAMMPLKSHYFSLNFRAPTTANINWKSNLIWILGNINLSQILRIRLELYNNLYRNFLKKKIFGEAAARPSNIIFLPTLLPISLEKEWMWARKAFSHGWLNLCAWPWRSGLRELIMEISKTLHYSSNSEKWRTHFWVSDSSVH